MKLLPRLTAEFTGTAMLLAIVVGSGVMGERLANGNEALALLANSLATGFGLFALILVFAPVSGAHFNPLVTLAAWSRRNLPARTALGFAVAQTCGAVAGIMLAHAMFDLPLLSAGEKIRTGTGQWLAEATATFGLLLTIFGATRYGIPTLAGAVGSYIAAAYWFTASTSFANPAVTIARALTATFAGIRPADVGGFILAQLVGALVALLLRRYFWPINRHLLTSSDREPVRE